MDEKKLLENISNAISAKMTHKKFADLLGMKEDDLKNRMTGNLFKVMKYAGLRKADTAMVYIHLAGV